MRVALWHVARYELPFIYVSKIRSWPAPNFLLMVDIEPGQFDDAPETDARANHTYIDTHPADLDESLLEYSEQEDDDDDEIDEAYDDNRVEDEDWEIADRGI